MVMSHDEEGHGRSTGKLIQTLCKEGQLDGTVDVFSCTYMAHSTCSLKTKALTEAKQSPLRSCPAEVPSQQHAR